MKTLTKTAEKVDFDALWSKVYLLREAARELGDAGCYLEIGHEMRYWEYAMALEALMQWTLKRRIEPSHYRRNAWQGIKIVDVGAGDSLLGPALALKCNLPISEVEPRESCIAHRIQINEYLARQQFAERLQLRQLDGEKYDVVFSISVAEHVAEQDQFWQQLADAVADNGMLFVTVDVVPEAGKKYVFDNLRAVNYTIERLQAVATFLQFQGFTWLGGEPDWQYHGNEVHDYSFCSMAFVKNEEKGKI